MTRRSWTPRASDSRRWWPFWNGRCNVGDLWLYLIFRFLVRYLFRPLMGVRWEGAENVPESGGCILAATHESFLDPPLSAGPLRPVKFLARQTLFLSGGRRSPSKDWLAGMSGVVQLDREGVGSRGVRQTIELLEAGWPVVMFPEGTRSEDGEVQDFRPGVGLIALRSGVPVVPVSIEGTHRVWGREQSFPRLWIRGVIRIRYGKPIVYRKPTKAKDVAADLRDRILDLRAEGRRDSPGDGESTHEIAGGGPST